MNYKLYRKFLEYVESPEKADEILEGLSKRELYLFEKYIEKIEDIVSSPKPKKEDVWLIINKGINQRIRKSIINLVKYAASIIIICALTYLLYEMKGTFSVNETAEKAEALEKIPNIAYLILSNGKTINLDNSKLIIDPLAADTILNESNNVLSYKNKKDSLDIELYNTVVVPRGAEYSVNLADGSTIKLNSESKLKYPTSFSGDFRKVWLEGEGYFNIRRNEKKPFIVQACDNLIEVLGTSFNINAYKENNSITTTLVKGSVKVIQNNKSIVLKPNQQAISEDGSIICKNIDVTTFISWIYGRFYFKEKSLEYVMKQMERWFNVETFFINEEVKNYKLNGIINKYISAGEMIDILQEAADVKMRMKGKLIFIEKG